MSNIYMDHASSTYTSKEVLKTMLPYFTEEYGNAESLHTKGKEALIAIDKARETIAEILNCRQSEIIFTGSGTESNNLAILGIARAQKTGHLITTEIEHPSVLNCFKQLEKEGFECTYLPVNKEGFVNPDDLKAAIRPNTILISIIYANNEIGTIQPISELAAISGDIPFHTDACQAANSLPLNLNVDSITINGSKIYGPKGVGALFLKRGTKIKAIMQGGSQEHSLRPGTHNTPAIIGLAKALELAQEGVEKENARLTLLQEKLISELLKIPGSQLNGPQPGPTRLPNNINISFPKIDREQLILNLDSIGIYSSASSACKSGDSQISHVMTAIKQNNSPLRLTTGKITTEKDIDYCIEEIPRIVEKLKTH
ncbi:cysteine desulfurase [Candidatus Gracilibacteria bacterium]|nr:cysteine desulfurase [Candidatus Gracilibacteria bacterium]